MTLISVEEEDLLRLEGLVQKNKCVMDSLIQMLDEKQETINLLLRLLQRYREITDIQQQIVIMLGRNQYEGPSRN